MQNIIGLIITFALVGCGSTGTARLVDGTTQGGEVVLEGSYMDRVAEAMRVMAIHCDGEFAVLDDSDQSVYVDAPTREQTHAEFVCTDRTLAEN